jgi:hypothetical protein
MPLSVARLFTETRKSSGYLYSREIDTRDKLLSEADRFAATENRAA